MLANCTIPSPAVCGLPISAFFQKAGEGELFMLRRESLKSAPTLHQYEGAPRTLMLHQLLLSPIFGLTIVDSKPVEQMREEYKQLQRKDKNAKTSTDKR